MDGAAQSSREVLETIPLVMRTIRTQMRRRRGPDLSVPQFRTLAFLHQTPGASLSDVAEHLGLTPPSMSKLIDGLVTRGLVTRRESTADRRRVTLLLTDTGTSTFAAAHGATQEFIAKVLLPLADADQQVIVRAMQLLRSTFSAILMAAEVQA